MKKNLLTLGVLITSLSASAQADKVLMHVGDTGVFYVGNGALVYNGGGLQTKESGKMEVSGNVMVVGNGNDDAFKTINSSNGDKVDGGNIILKLNDPTNFATSTYGQLYITGVSQDRIKGIVDKQYRDLLQGSFQQMSIPFAGKTFSSFAANLLKPGNFANARNINALGYNDNTKTVLRVANPSASTDDFNTTSAVYGPTTYFSVGTGGWTPSPTSTSVLTLKGKPFSDTLPGMQVVLTNGGKPGGTPLTYGSYGQNINEFNEKYNSYINDPFDTPQWSANYGKELYQYGNPFLTNIDLSKIGLLDGTAIGDGNRLPVQGIRYSQSNILFGSGGTTTTTNNTVTFAYTSANTVTSVGDVNFLVIKPLGAVYIKLNSTLETTYASTFSRNLNFNTLRRFNSTARAIGTDYSVTAAKQSSTPTVKQIGVIALNSSGVEVGRTYYAVAPSFTTGFNSGYSVQANTGYSNNVPVSTKIYTNEEFPAGGIDQTYSNLYNLYINEANETDFLHKQIPLTVGSDVAKLKFEIRENAELVPANTNTLSAGEGFWMRINGVNTQLAQDAELNISQGNFGLYYGEPQTDGTLGVNENTKSLTAVVFDKNDSEFYAIFDKNWKSANIEVYDFSGKLILSEKSVRTNSNYKLRIPRDTKNAFLVVMKSDNGQIYNTKIMR